MRCISLVASFFAGSLLVVSASGQTNVRVLQYDIHRDVGANSPNSSGAAYLAHVVNYANPDVWEINELGGAWARPHGVEVAEFFTNTSSGE